MRSKPAATKNLLKRPYDEKDLAGDVCDYLHQCNTYSRGIYEKMHARHIATGNQVIVRIGEQEFLITCAKRNQR